MNINEAGKQAVQDKKILLLDVRTRPEFLEGHLPGSRNLPLDAINQISSFSKDKSQPIYVYCASGARSKAAVGILKRAGYENAENIGGFNDWRGSVEY